jgi:hypothetical protein
MMLEMNQQHVLHACLLKLHNGVLLGFLDRPWTHPFIVLLAGWLRGSCCWVGGSLAIVPDMPRLTADGGNQHCEHAGRGWGAAF